MEVTKALALQLSQHPLRLAYNRVWRAYRGGYLIDVLRGSNNPMDNHFPEDWLFSDTRAINEGREEIIEGLSEVVLDDGSHIPLRDLLQAAPEAFLGGEHVRSFGSKAGLLVKLLDSCERLQVQVHPSRDYSRRYLNDRFGKTESWLILGTRRIGGSDPYILMGFNQRVSKADMADLIQRQDSAGMEQVLNKLPAKPGDMYIIRAGMPHAIGPGVFMVEVQEPTDWVVLAELQCGEVRLSERAAFMGLGLDLALDTFDFTGPVGADAIASATLTRRPGATSAETVLVGPEATDCFTASELTVIGDLSAPHRGRSYSGVVVHGQGEIVSDTGSMPLRQGDAFFMPASSQHLGYRSRDGMRIIASFPPD
ncbi:MAG: class I mannose-6-phosphate isomerase [Anaerolineae bacterium]